MNDDVGKSLAHLFLVSFDRKGGVAEVLHDLDILRDPLFPGQKKAIIDDIPQLLELVTKIQGVDESDDLLHQIVDSFHLLADGVGEKT
jgi:hypothetical protein